MKPVHWVHWIARVLVVIGALNWGLVGLFEYDLVAAIFGGQEEPLSRLVYVLVGAAGIVLAVTSLSGPAFAGRSIGHERPAV